jgi:hypothetical protein
MTAALELDLERARTATRAVKTSMATEAQDRTVEVVMANV